VSASASASNARKEGNISVCRCGYTAPGGTVGSGFPRLFRDVILMARGLPYCTVLYCTVLYCTVLYCTVLYLQ
jgi:hypothetical protein